MPPTGKPTFRPGDRFAQVTSHASRAATVTAARKLRDTVSPPRLFGPIHGEDSSAGTPAVLLAAEPEHFVDAIFVAIHETHIRRSRMSAMMSATVVNTVRMLRVDRQGSRSSCVHSAVVPARATLDLPHDMTADVEAIRHVGGREVPLHL